MIKSKTILDDMIENKRNEIKTKHTEDWSYRYTSFYKEDKAYLSALEQVKKAVGDEITSLKEENERLSKILSPEGLYERFSNSYYVNPYLGGWGGDCPQLDYFIHECWKSELKGIKEKYERCPVCGKLSMVLMGCSCGYTGIDNCDKCDGDRIIWVCQNCATKVRIGEIE